MTAGFRRGTGGYNASPTTRRPKARRFGCSKARRASERRFSRRSLIPYTCCCSTRGSCAPSGAYRPSMSATGGDIPGPPPARRGGASPNDSSTAHTPLGSPRASRNGRRAGYAAAAFFITVLLWPALLQACTAMPFRAPRASYCLPVLCTSCKNSLTLPRPINGSYAYNCATPRAT